ncbi:MAG: adenosylmethionine--8-amino-7-oxononanoate transaminase [Gillisia sp.]
MESVKTLENLTEKDQEYIWHPLTQHKTSSAPLVIKKAKNCILYSEDGKEYIDGIASWYTCMYGHCNDFIIQKVSEQMQQLDQVVFSGFTHEPAIRLSEELINILPEGQKKVFFNDNGSTATEIGIKMALQYHHNLGNNRKVMMAFEEGFHGDTFGAMSVSSLSVYNGAFEDHFIQVVRIPVPNGKNTDGILQKIEALHNQSPLAGFIYEPLVQGAAAMKMHNREGLDKILEFCKSKDIILVADEVMTGFGKTGKNFASEYMQTTPDVVCLSKALTAGLVPMGATSCSQKIFDAFYDEDISKGLFHGHTYTGNPLACTAALAGMELLRSDEIQQNIQRISASHAAFAKKIESHSKIKNLRQLGIIFAFDLEVEMERYGSLRNKLFSHFMNDGIYLRPLGNTIYISAPYTISAEQLGKIYTSAEKLLESFE